MTNTYYLMTMFSAAYTGYRGSYHETILIVSIILSGTSALACAICTFCAAIICLRAAYILQRRATGSSTTLIAPFEENYDVIQRTYTNTVQRQQPLMQQMEEQSVYWSSDENPYFYHTSKRYYGQPYFIESGFHGYVLAHPHISETANIGIENFRQRHMNSSAVQTRIGHAFD
uniref:Uncharacterized protein n=1 Tax=Parascaris univalens TaxID=6257 RepID=A0A915C0M7_PARUN